MLRELIGKLLKECRKKAGLTQKEVAQVCGTTKGEISKLEKGKIKKPSILLFLSYLQAIGIPKGDFFSQLDKMGIEELLPKVFLKPEGK